MQRHAYAVDCVYLVTNWNWNLNNRLHLSVVYVSLVDICNLGVLFCELRAISLLLLRKASFQRHLIVWKKKIRVNKKHK